MTGATPQMRRFAKRLMVYETRRNRPSAATTGAAFPVSDKLRPHLATMMGNGGYRALLSRALVLATTEVPWLRAIKVNADATLEGWEQLRAEHASVKFQKGRVVLLAQLLGLLVALIGPGLTVHLLSEIWPANLFDDRNFGKRDKK